MNAKNARLPSLFSHFSQLAASAVITLGVLVLLGWALDLTALKSLRPGWAAMRPNTALAFVLAGLSLWSGRIEAGKGQALWLAQAGAVAVFLLGALTLVELLGSWDLGVDRLLSAGIPEHPNAVLRMAPNTAFNFTILGVALYCFARKGGTRLLGMAHFLTVLASLVALVALVGHAYHIDSLYQVDLRHAPMALHTSVGFLALGAGILGALPDHGLMQALASESVAGVSARRMLPATIGFPLVGGWLILQGHQTGWFDDEFAVALATVTTIVVFTALIRWNATMLYRTDARRRQAEQDMIHHQAELEELVEKRTAELTAVYRGLDTAREEQKAGIAREIHDELGGILAALKMTSTRIHDYLRQIQADAEMVVHSAKSTELIESAIDFKRRIVNDLRPSVLDDLGIASAIQWQAGDFTQRTGIPCEVTLYDDEAQLGREASLVLFRILQEALTNVGKYARATRVQITLSREENTVTLEIGDNGIGTLPPGRDRDHAGSHGLRGMQERARQLGGRVSIIGFPGKGTWIEVILPLAPAS
jgi:signal transduction histidine kinase